MEKHSIALPLRMIRMHRTQSDDACFDYRSRITSCREIYEMTYFELRSVSRALDWRAEGRRFDSRGSTILGVLKQVRNEGTSFALQMARPSRASDDHVKWRSRLHL